MRIALVISSFLPEGSNGGLATFYFELASALADAGHEVQVATLTQGTDSDEWLNGFRVSRRHFDASRYKNLQQLDYFPVTAWSLPRAVELYRTLCKILRDFQPDVIECVETGFEGLLWAVEHAYPLVVRSLCPQFHLMRLNLVGEFLEIDAAIAGALEVAVLSAADGLTTPSLSLAGIVSQETGIPVEEFSIIRNPMHAAPDQSPHMSQLPKQKGALPELLYVGRVEVLKGCDLLVEALPMLAQKYPDFHLTVVGSESRLVGEDLPYADRLRARLKELRMRDRVDFLGVLPRDEIREHVSSADLCIFPSRYDSSPYACLEAMSYGAAVVAAKVGGIPEYVEHGRSGWLVTPGDANALADAIVLLTQDQSLRKKLGEEAQLCVSRLCDPSLVARESVALYEKSARRFARAASSRGTGLVLVQRILTAFDEFCFPEQSAIAAKIQTTWTEAVRLAREEAYQAGFDAGRNTVLGSTASLVMTVLRRIKKRVLATTGLLDGK